MAERAHLFEFLPCLSFTSNKCPSWRSLQLWAWDWIGWPAMDPLAMVDWAACSIQGPACLVCSTVPTASVASITCITIASNVTDLLSWFSKSEFHCKWRQPYASWSTWYLLLYNCAGLERKLWLDVHCWQMGNATIWKPHGKDNSDLCGTIPWQHFHFYFHATCFSTGNVCKNIQSRNSLQVFLSHQLCFAIRELLAATRLGVTRIRQSSFRVKMNC